MKSRPSDLTTMKSWNGCKWQLFGLGNGKKIKKEET